MLFFQIKKIFPYVLTTSGSKTKLWSKEKYQHPSSCILSFSPWALSFLSCSSCLRNKENTSMWPRSPPVTTSWFKQLKLMLSSSQRTIHLNANLRKSTPTANGSSDQIQLLCFHSFERIWRHESHIDTFLWVPFPPIFFAPMTVLKFQSMAYVHWIRIIWIFS